MSSAASATSRTTSKFEELGRRAAEQDFVRHTHDAFATPSLLEEMGRYVLERPLRSMLVGVGVGLLIAAVVVRR